MYTIHYRRFFNLILGEKDIKKDRIDFTLYGQKILNRLQNKLKF